MTADFGREPKKVDFREVVDSIESLMTKSKCRLTADQKTILTGALAVWIPAAIEQGRREVRHD